jgi:DNA-binding CsgD family transcriptional regulator/tetratricopeptide (TPR) repeat protein
MLRVERLSAAARGMLSLVAVGHELDHGLLEETSGLEPRAVRDALREAVDGHILVVQDDDLYRFRHALLREVVEDDLLPGEAAALLERALELWDRVPDAEGLAGVDRLTLLARAADAAAALGDPGRQLALLEAAFAGLGPQPDPRRAAPILESTARAQRHLNRAKASIATLERGLELVRRRGGDGDPSSRASLLAALARAHMLVAHFEHAAGVAREALEVAVAADLPLLEGLARNTLGFSLAMTGEVDAGIAELREAIRIARKHDNLYDLGEAYNNHADVLHSLGRSDEALAVALEGRQAVARAKADIDAVPQQQDRRDRVRRRRLGAVGEQPARPAAMDRHAVARRHPAEAGRARHGPRAPRGRRCAVSRARADGRGLQRAAGARVARSSHGRAGTPRGRPHGGERRHRRVARAARVLQRRCDRRGGVGGRGRDRCGRRRHARSRPRRRRGDVGRPAPRRRAARPNGRRGHAGQAGRGRGAAGRTRRGLPRRRARGRGAVRTSGGGLGRRRRPEPAARMRWREADAHAAAGDRDAAAEAARAAHATAVRLGAGWLRGEIEGLAVRARLTLEPDVTGDEGREAHEEDAFGLTSRERQVLALIAEGATNREIGATLFMAEKTASVHVSRILAKLNVRSRTEAAAVAHRHRLAEPGGK